MRSSVVVCVLLLGLLVAGTSSAPANAVAESRPGSGSTSSVVSSDAGPASVAARGGGRWRPARGPVFNDPVGGPRARKAIVRLVHRAIRLTRRGETIRFATYAIDRDDTVDLLVAARRRGVRVQVVVNDNLIGRVERRLQRRLGNDRRRPSFLVVCSAACRNDHPAGNQHMKIYSFTRTGGAKDVIISSSANLSGGGSNAQWNDAFTIHGDRKVFVGWMKTFRELSLDRAALPRRLRVGSADLSLSFQRPAGSARVRSARSGDLALERVRAISCKAPAGFGTRAGRTMIRINMYAWYGSRGERIAREVAARKRAGCDVAVIGSVVSAKVVRIMLAAGIRVKAADWDWGEKQATSGKGLVYGSRCYSHLKFITVDGAYDGRGTTVVFTGSENWSAPSLSSDEVTIESHDRRAVRAYNRQWKRMWDSRNATHAVFEQPQRRPCAR